MLVLTITQVFSMLYVLPLFLLQTVAYLCTRMLNTLQEAQTTEV